MEDLFYEADVLVIGGGLAGMQATLAASGRGARALLVCKGTFGTGGNTSRASGGFAVSLPGTEGDSHELFRQDLLRAGRELNDEALVDTFCGDAAAAIARLLAQGTRFAAREDGTLERFALPGHTVPRSVRCDGFGTSALMQPVSARVRESAEVIDGASIARLLVDDEGRVGGAEGFTAQGNPLRILAAATVLAGGGLGAIFPLTSNEPAMCGESYALAYEAGATLTGMEFLQFTPTAVAYPESVRGISTGGAIVAQRGVKLFNGRSERFVTEASTRDVLARAIYREVVEGRGSPHGGVYIDVSGIAPEVVAKVSGKFLARMRDIGIDPMQSRVEIAPELHFCMGGVRIDLEGRTNVEGLFCAGEAAGGLHGANRLNSNGLTEAAVFGWRAGEAAALVDRRARRPNMSEVSAPWDRNGEPLDTAAACTEVRAAMLAAAGIERDASGLQRGLDVLRSVRAPAYGRPSDGDVVAYLQLRAMLVTGELILRSALAREESRGAHYRTDFPAISDERYAVDVARGRDGMAVTRRALATLEAVR